MRHSKTCMRLWQRSMSTVSVIWRTEHQVPFLPFHLLFQLLTQRLQGPVTISAINKLKKGTKWNEIPFNSRGGGCGAAMRAQCIGLRFHDEQQVPHLIFLCT